MKTIIWGIITVIILILVTTFVTKDNISNIQYFYNVVIN
ncbi:hypothetical protein STFE110948_06885 [Streptobacillus felis]